MNLAGGLGKLFFSASLPSTGREPWTSDGTEAGTLLLKNINLGAGSSSPGELTRVGSTLFFTVATPDAGSELWKSDGTEQGTVLVKDIVPGPGSSHPFWLTRVGSTLFFLATHPDTGTELWKSDGTEAGTVLVKDIYPGPGSSLGNFATGRPTEVNGILFFAAFRPDTGWELWKSDGTDAGTVLVKDIVPGAGDSLFGTSWLSVNGTLFFSACHPETGCELWKSDGTEGGTVLVKDVTPGPGSSGAAPLIGVNGVVFFRTSSPLALWRTDGTEAGTALIREGIVPAPARCGGGGLATVNDTLVFLAQGAHTCELWKSDGVTAEPLMDVMPAPAFANDLGAVSGLVLLSAYDDAHGLELWATDGTSTTGMVQDIAVGAGWSSPSSFTPVGSLVFFTANDHVTGLELWAMSKSAIHRALNLPEPNADVAAQDEPTPRRRGAAGEFRAFLPAFEDDDETP